MGEGGHHHLLQPILGFEALCSLLHVWDFFGYQTRKEKKLQQVMV